MGGINAARCERSQFNAAGLDLESGVARHLNAAQRRLGLNAQTRVLGLANQPALNDAGVAEVHTHPVSRIQARPNPSAEPDSQFRRGVLRLPVQDVVIALVAIVQETSHRSQECQRLVKLR